MTRHSTSAALVIALLAIVAPAMALQPPQSDAPRLLESEQAAIIAALKQQGINATDVEQWGDYVRAFVVKDDGSISMQLFEQDRLKPVR